MTKLLIAALISVAIIFALTLTGQNLNDTFGEIARALRNLRHDD